MANNSIGAYAQGGSNEIGAYEKAAGGGGGAAGKAIYAFQWFWHWFGVN